MPTSEKFCLKWNDFQQNINTAFESLRKDVDFTDVTLACEDGNQVEAHKVVLAALSPFFHNLLKRNKHVHPLIYMRGLKFEDLLAIVDFLYYGEANIYQENRDNFLNIAEELELKGLNGSKGGDENGGGDCGTPQKQVYQPPVLSTQQTNCTSETNKVSQKNSFHSQPYSEVQVPSSTAIALPKQDFSGDMKELDEQIETMMGQGENFIKHGASRIKAFICQVCGKEGLKWNIKDHIEANHLEGISIPCSFCEKSFRSRNSLRNHVKAHN